MSKRAKKRHIVYLPIALKLFKVKEAGNKLVSTPIAVANMCDDLAELAQEMFQILTLNTRNMLIARHTITLGTINSSLVHPREVFRPAIADGANAIVLVHNHPSGDPQPSAEDIKITRRLVEAGQLLDIEVVDHIIIGRENHFSLREVGLVDFD